MHRVFTLKYLLWYSFLFAAIRCFVTPAHADVSRLGPMNAWFKTTYTGTVAYSPTGNVYAATQGFNMVSVCRASDGVRLSSMMGAVAPLAISPDGQLLATGSRDRTVKIWRTSDGSLLRETIKSDYTSSCLAFSPDGRYLASGETSPGARLKFWNVADAQLVRTIPNGAVSEATNTIAFSPDSTYVATNGSANTVAIWRVGDGTLYHNLYGHTAVVRGIRFSPDGKSLLSCSDDNTIHMWKPDTASLLWTSNADFDGLNVFDVSQDGQLMVTGGNTTVLKL